MDQFMPCGPTATTVDFVGNDEDSTYLDFLDGLLRTITHKNSRSGNKAVVVHVLGSFWGYVVVGVLPIDLEALDHLTTQRCVDLLGVNGRDDRAMAQQVLVRIELPEHCGRC